MTANERNALKALVSERQRERYEQDQVPGERCAGCGCRYEWITWDCEHCRERTRSKHRREVKALEQRVADMKDLLDGRDRDVARLREQLNQERARRERAEEEARVLRDRATVAVLRDHRYESEAERQAARRRTWRDSKRRAAARRVMAT